MFETVDYSLVISIILIVILLISSALFSASETAAVASSKAKLQTLIKNGDKRAALVVKLRQNMGGLISAILIGNTLVNTAIATLGTGICVELFGEMGVAYATVLMGILIVFYAEVLPKIYTISMPEVTALRLFWLMRFTVALFAPVTRLTDKMGRKILHFFGVAKLSPNSSITSTEEIRGLIDLHVGPGSKVAHERAMLRGILDLPVVNVGEIMTHRKNLFTLEITDKMDKILAQILECPYTRIPLWRDNPDNIIGILHIKELFRALQKAKGALENINIYEIANKPWFVPDSTTLLDQLQEFRQRREHFALVIDEYGALMGVVTLEDILEEIVGEISDEHDIPIPGVRVAQDGALLVAGAVTIRDLNRQFEWNLPDENATTIAGLILHETQSIPEVGQTFMIYGLKFEILRRQRNQLTLIRVSTPLPNANEE